MAPIKHRTVGIALICRKIGPVISAVVHCDESLIPAAELTLASAPQFVWLVAAHHRFDATLPTAWMPELEQRKEQLPTTAGTPELEQRKEQLPKTGQ